mmetsp:Transcript_74452/g.209942  ORF Transcript_74452/g.209942 Transcript_74452/m.209942 type:complete len:453 (-) Transcript_74452:178-1536(-)
MGGDSSKQAPEPEAPAPTPAAVPAAAAPSAAAPSAAAPAPAAAAAPAPAAAAPAAAVPTPPAPKEPEKTATPAAKAEAPSSPKAAPKKEAASPKAEAKAASPDKKPLPPGEVKGEGPPEGDEKEGRGKGKKDKGEGSKEPRQPQAPVGTKLCVKNLPEDTTSDSLKALFASYGVVANADSKAREDGKCRGFGFVTMGSPEEATKAMAALNGSKAGDKELMVVVAEKREKTEEKGKGKGKDKGVGKGDKGAGKGKDTMGKGKGKATVATPQSQTPQAGYNPYTNAAYMQAYYQQYPYMQNYYQAYGYAAQQQMQQYAAAAAAASPAAAAAYQTPQASYQAYQQTPQAAYQPNFGALSSGANKEFEGSLKSLSEKHGYGFIACEEARQLYQRDVYIHSNQVPTGAKVLDRVRFTIKAVEKEKKDKSGEIQKEMRPTAENVRIVHTTAAALAASS